VTHDHTDHTDELPPSVTYTRDVIDMYSLTAVCFITRIVTSSVVLVVASVGRDQKVAGSTPGQGAIKSTRSTQPSIPPG